MRRQTMGIVVPCIPATLVRAGGQLRRSSTDGQFGASNAAPLSAKSHDARSDDARQRASTRPSCWTWGDGRARRRSSGKSTWTSCPCPGKPLAPSRCPSCGTPTQARTSAGRASSSRLRSPSSRSPLCLPGCRQRRDWRRHRRSSALAWGESWKQCFMFAIGPCRQHSWGSFHVRQPCGGISG